MIKKITYLYCDGPHCKGENEPWRHAPPPRWTAADQRRRAHAEGWIHRHGKDYCPDCKGTLAALAGN